MQPWILRKKKKSQFSDYLLNLKKKIIRQNYNESNLLDDALKHIPGKINE